MKKLICMVGLAMLPFISHASCLNEETLEKCRGRMINEYKDALIKARQQTN